MKRIAVAIIIAASSVFAQSDESFPALMRDANTCAAAWNDGKYEILASYLAKRYFKKDGSPERVAAELRREIDALKRAFVVHSMIITLDGCEPISSAPPFLVF